MLYDRIVLEKHFYVATRAERIQNSNHWILTINKEGAQKPLNQRPDFAQATRECKRLHDEHLARTQEDFRTIPPSQQARHRKRQPVEGIEEYDYAADPETSWNRRQIEIKPIGRRAVGILSILQALTICELFFSQS